MRQEMRDHPVRCRGPPPPKRVVPQRFFRQDLTQGDLQILLE